jgi:hypothetical protein
MAVRASNRVDRALLHDALRNSGRKVDGPEVEDMIRRMGSTNEAILARLVRDHAEQKTEGSANQVGAFYSGWHMLAY